ncbi:MAG: protein kinase [Cyanobacteria bacterium HKST-UBA02]|nr:protein kinase [Cyanobacteria bacterium HKST-UBA02]
MEDDKDIGITGEPGDTKDSPDARPEGGATGLPEGNHNHNHGDPVKPVISEVVLTPKKGVLSGLVKKVEDSDGDASGSDSDSDSDSGSGPGSDENPLPPVEGDPLPFIRQLEHDMRKEAQEPEGEEAPSEPVGLPTDLEIDDIPNEEFEDDPEPPAEEKEAPKEEQEPEEDDDDDIGWATKPDPSSTSGEGTETTAGSNDGWHSGPVVPVSQVEVVGAGAPAEEEAAADEDEAEEEDEEIEEDEDHQEVDARSDEDAEAFRVGFDSGKFSTFSPVRFDIKEGEPAQSQEESVKLFGAPEPDAQASQFDSGPVPASTPASASTPEPAPESVRESAAPAPVATDASSDVKVDRFLNKVILDTYSAHRLLAHDDVSALYVGKGINVVGHVAIKVSKFKRVEDAKEFVQEIRSRSLEHPAIARLLEAESDDSGLAFLVYEYPECITLSELLEGVGRVDKEEDIAGVLTQLADAFVTAHEGSVYHGSLSAGKILLLESKGSIAVRVLDFGSPSLHRELCNFVGGGKKLRAPQYMSPEIIDGFDPGAQSDIYSIGVVAYQLITGALPYPYENSDEIIAAHRDPETMPDPVTKMRPDLINNQQLSQLVYEAMETDPDWRFDAIKEFRDGIEGWITSVRETKAARAAGQAAAQDSKFDVTDYDEIMTARQSERDLKTSILNLVALKQKSMEQEQTVVIQLTDKFKIGGQRQSPIRTLLTVGGLTILVLGIVGGGLFYASGHQEELGAAWMSASRQLSGLFHKGAPGDEEQLEDTLEAVDESLSTEDGTKKPGTTPGAAGTNLPGGGTTTAPPPVRRAVRKFRYEESPIYKDYVPKSKGSEPIIIK